MLRRLSRALQTVAMLLLAAGAITLFYVGWTVNHTGLNDRARPADAIVILGAQVAPDGQPGPDLYVRTLHASRLYERGLAPYLVCTGGFSGDRLSAAAVACNLAVTLGVPADRVLLADGSMTTREDAASARNLMLSRGWHTAILVSHPLHLERARLLFEAQGLAVYPSPTNTDLASIPWRTRAWLTARETLGIVWLGLEELGVPYEWTGLLSQLVYGPSAIEAE